MKRTNPWETYLPVGTFRNELFYTTNPSISYEKKKYQIHVLHLVVLVEPMVSHDEPPQPRHVGVGALPGDEEVVGIPAREGETADGRQRAQLRILARKKEFIPAMLSLVKRKKLRNGSTNVFTLTANRCRSSRERGSAHCGPTLGPRRSVSSHLRCCRIQIFWV